MNENDKAAIAAGMFRPFTVGGSGIWYDEHANKAPDMHLPENLWRALENLIAKKWFIGFDGPFDYLRLQAVKPDREHDFSGVPTEQFFAALVALYDAEHP